MGNNTRQLYTHHLTNEHAAPVHNSALVIGHDRVLGRDEEEKEASRDAEHGVIGHINADLKKVVAYNEADRDGPREHDPPAGELVARALLVVESPDPAARIEQNPEVNGEQQREKPAGGRDDHCDPTGEEPCCAEAEVHRLGEAEKGDALGGGDLADGGEP
eukprot:scaffold519_cov30-Tisochrysis_lutea.AAC.4